MNQRIYKLPCLDHRKSFYGKAYVIELDDGEKFLQSYDTIVCMIDKCGKFKRLWDGYSTTTQRHVNSFLIFFGMPQYCGKAEWDKLPVEDAEFNPAQINRVKPYVAYKEAV